MVLPVDFIDAARRYLGVRWAHLGRSEHGVDCVGLLIVAAKEVGIDHQMPPPYPRGQRGFDMMDACAKWGREVQLRDAQDGDVLLFADGHYPAHMGIRTTKEGVPYVLHARLNRRKVVEEPLTHELADAVRRAYRPFAFESEAGVP